jgi:hypothetical protein
VVGKDGRLRLPVPLTSAGTAVTIR